MWATMDLGNTLDNNKPQNADAHLTPTMLGGKDQGHRELSDAHIPEEPHLTSSLL